MSTTPFLKHPHWNSLIIFDVFSCVVFVLCRVLVRLATHPSSLCAVAQQTFYRSVAASLASYPPNTRRRSHHSSKPHEQPHQTEVFVSVQSRGSHHSLHKSLPTIGPFSPSFAAFVTTSRHQNPRCTRRRGSPHILTHLLARMHTNNHLCQPSSPSRRTRRYHVSPRSCYSSRHTGFSAQPR